MTSAAPYSSFAPEYDRTIGGHSFELTRRNFEAVVRRFGLRFGSAADLGCGTGLFARYLCRRFQARVFAIDRSPEMASAARRRCAGLPIQVLQQDIRRLVLPRPVELMTANFDTLNHLLTPRDLRTALRAAARHLASGGHFFGDFLTPAMPMPPGARVVVRFPHLTQVLRWLPRHHLLRCHVVLRCGSAAPVVEQHWERVYLPSMLRRLFGEAGLGVISINDAGTGEPLNRPAPRIVIVARR